MGLYSTPVVNRRADSSARKSTSKSTSRPSQPQVGLVLHRASVALHDAAKGRVKQSEVHDQAIHKHAGRQAGFAQGVQSGHGRKTKMLSI